MALFKSNFSFLKDDIYHFKNIGKRKIQEDDFFICDIVDIEKIKYNVVFIFDGHGAKENIKPLPEYIIKNNILSNELKIFFQDKKMTTKNLMIFFLKFDSFLEKKINKGIGTCFSAVLISLNFIYTVTLGDTMIEIYDTNLNLFFKTEIHDFSNKYEIDRYKKQNQHVLIKENRYKGLLISRTLGDFDCKTVGEQCLIALPDVKKIYNNKEFIFVLKTDGMIISSKTLLSKYNKKTLEGFLNKKQFNDNACLLIFENKFISNDKEMLKTEILNKNDNLYLNFLKYVYDN